MNKLIGIFFVLLSFGIFSQVETTINLKVKKSRGKYIYLQKSGQKEIVDSAKIKWWGKAKLKASVEEPSFYQVSKNKKDGIPLILLNEKPEQIKITTTSSIVNNYTITGSEDSELLHQYFGVKNNKEISKDSLAQYAQQFIEQNRGSLAVFIALGDVKEQKKYFQIAERGISETFPNSPYHDLLKKYIADIEKKNGKPSGPANIGSIAPELDFESPDGKVISLESLRGKYVLIDFWASWCGPCRRENPTVVRLYNKYKDAGFDVYSVSLDNNKSRWEAAIKKDGLIWPSHVSDLKQWRSAAVKKYGFGGIPYTVLIDKEGKIIATKLRGAQLENKLKDLFKF